MLVLYLLIALILIVLSVSYICFRMAFYASRKKNSLPDGAVDLPPGPVYEPYHPIMTKWAMEVRTMPYREYRITSRDGLPLYARLYEYAPGSPIEIMLHGYRGNAERDLCGGIQRCFALGRSALLVDQRCAGKSGGKVITFGIRESLDAVDWAHFMAKTFPERKLILCGISMGASTVLMAGAHPLPPQVAGILADCGFTSPRAIIRKVIAGMHLPPTLAYPFVRLGAVLYGGFDPDAGSALEAAAKCRLPVIFFHGEADDFVPCSMSRENYEACTARKQLCTIPGAGHGLSFPAAPERYLKELGDFFREDLQ